MDRSVRNHGIWEDERGGERERERGRERVRVRRREEREKERERERDRRISRPENGRGPAENATRVYYPRDESLWPPAPPATTDRAG